MNGGHVGLGWFDAKIPPWSLAQPRCPLPSSSSQQYSPVQKAFTFTISTMHNFNILTFSTLWLFDCESVIWSAVNLIVDIFNQQIGRNYFGDIEKTKCVKVLRSSGNVCCLINRGGSISKERVKCKKSTHPRAGGLAQSCKRAPSDWLLSPGDGGGVTISALRLGDQDGGWRPDGFLWRDCRLLCIAAWRTLSPILASLCIASTFHIYSLYNYLYISLYSLYN